MHVFLQKFIYTSYYRYYHFSFIIISVLFDTCIHLNLEDQIVFDSAVQSFSYISAG